MPDEPQKDQNAAAQRVAGSGDSDSITIPELERFVFRADRFTGEVVPRKLEPAEVARFLVERLTEKDSLKSFVQAEKVAAFYDTYEVGAKFRQFLDRAEDGDESVTRSVVIARTIGRSGTPDDIQFARHYYSYLVGRVESMVNYEEIIRLHEVLDLGDSSAELRQRLAAKLTSLEERKDSSDQARLEYLAFAETISESLDRAEKVQAVKDKMLQIPDRNQRIIEEIKAYLGIEYGYLEYLESWAAMRLRRETWGAHPSEQVLRPSTAPYREDVVSCLRGFLSEIEESGSLSEEEKEGARLKVLRAIKFFDGVVTEQEEFFLEKFEGAQADILANEGFLLP